MALTWLGKLWPYFHKGEAQNKSHSIVEAEEEDFMWQMMAEALEDERPDNGAIEIGTDNEWQ